MTEDMYKKLKRTIFDKGADAIEDLLGVELHFNTDEELSAAMDNALKQMTADKALALFERYCGGTKRLYISMTYIFVGDTHIDIPQNLLEEKTEEEQLKIAYEYASENIHAIPVARNAEYIPYSDSFELEDVSF